MYNNSINSNGTDKVSGSNSVAQKSQPSVNVNSLFRQLTDLQEILQEIRQAQNNNGSNDNENGQTSNPYLNDAISGRELNYLSRISQIQGQLEDAGVKGNSPQIENYNSVSNQSLSGQSEAYGSSSSNGFDSVLNGIGDGFKSFTDTLSNGFNSFTDAVGNGFKAVGTAFNNAKNWFVSQLPGATNVNEDSGKNNSNCGFAALEMIRRLRGGQGDAMTANTDIENDRRASGITMDESKGALPEELAKGAQNLGMNAKATVGSINDAASVLGQGKNIILAVDPSKYKSGLSPSGHAVVLLAVDPAKGTAILGDPAEQNGPIEVSLKDLGVAMDAMGNRIVEIG